MFNWRKKTARGGGQHAQQAAQANAKLKHSLLSLEQRLMFDAAAAATAAEVNQEQVAQEQAEAAVSSHAGGDGPTADQRESQDLLQAIATYHPGESTTEMAFVDPTVPNYQEMIAGIGANVDVVVLDATRDGMEQIAESLAGRSDIDAIHLISHGSAGELQLGTGTLTAESMAGEYANEMATIRAALSDQADLMVYGCSFGEGSEGVEAVNLLAEITGADVAASNDRTGHIDLGGDWEFEVQVGSIETDLALTDATQMNWVGILGTETVSDTFSSKSYSNNDGTQSWSANWVETDHDGGGAEDGNIRVHSNQLRIDVDRVGDQIYREVNLSGVTSATLSFDYTSTLKGADCVEARISNDGGASYVTLPGGVFSGSLRSGSGSASFDISPYASSNTRVQFVVTGEGGEKRLVIDNIHISHVTGSANSAPTITSDGGSATASVTVNENDTAVRTVAAADVDAGQTLGYSIVGGADAAKFMINSSTGELSFASAPNYEAPTDSGGNNVYDVTVQVSDGQSGTDTQAISVALTNVNEGPSDLSLSGNTVAEHAANGTVVGTVTGTDPDNGDTKAYSLTDSAGGRFAINSSTGQITVADGSLLNYENATSHTVTVRVTDSGGQSYDETFAINLTNVNEAPTGADATVTITEDTAHTLTTANFGFSDVDAGDSLSAVRIDTIPSTGSLTLSGVAVTAGQVVTVADITAGRLVFSPAADANGTGYASFTFSVQDSHSAYDAAPNTLTFNVTAVNDAPVDLSLSANSVAENAATGTVVGTVSGTDPDAGDTKTYSLTDTAAGRFAIDRATGQLTVADGSLLNYEAATSHTLTVRVTDSGGQSYDETFSINLTNVNEGPTDLALSANTVAENATTGTAVGTVSGTDVDAGDTKTYSLTDTAGGRFAIDSATGQLTVADGSLLNYERAASHTVTVRVTDSGGQSYTESFTINLTNVNEGPTDLSLSVNSVSEHAANGTVVGTVSGTDPDAGDTTSYSLTDTAGGRFAINSSTGQLTVADGTLLNYEAATSHSVTVRMTDAGGLTHDETFAINLTNVNEAPTITSNGGGATASLNVAENQTTVTTVAAMDVDTGTTLTYSLAGGPDAARFSIDGATGALRFSAAPNFERASDVGRNNVYDVTVRVSDGQGGTATQSISVRVTDVNEAPRITSNRGGDVAFVTIRENSTAVTKVRATDQDAGAQITYSVVGGADAAFFTINPSTGVLRFSSAPNFEQPTDTDRNNAYQVVVQASDGRGGVDSQVISVRVTNVNEAPTDLSLSANTVPENAATGTVIGTVTSIDPDTRDTKSYSLTDTAGGRFAIHKSTGVMTVANESLLDYESATSHSVTVRVTDTSGLTYDETFTIHLTNVNEAPTGTDAAVTINEDTAHTLTTANFGFSDVDAGDRLSAVRINSLPGAGSLTLSGVAVTAGEVIAVSEITAGHLVFTPVADANGTGYASVTFSVQDNHGAYDVGPNTLTFDVTAVNDVTVVTGGTSGTGTEDTTLTGTLTATDVEGVSDGSVYSVTGAATHGTASIDPATGLWSYTPNADSNGSDSFTVTITDDTGNTTTQVISVSVTAVNDAPTDVPLITGTLTEDQTLTADTSGLGDADGLGPFNYQWLRDGVAIAGATGSTYTLGDADVGTQISITVSYIDGQGTSESVTSAQTAPVLNANDDPLLVTNSGSTVVEGRTDTIDASELAVTDVDNNAVQLTYTISTGPAHGRLELITAPGISTSSFTQADILANRLVYVHDGSETTSDSFTFTVSDGAGGTLGTTTMTLTITPVNDAPTITSNGGTSTATITVAENISAVTIVMGADVDLPTQALTYSISGGVDQALFTINAVTGALHFVAPPDFEAATVANGDNVYVVQVQVTDSQGAGTTQTIQVTVTNVTEWLPSIPTPPPILLAPLPTNPSGPGPSPASPEVPPMDDSRPVQEQTGPEGMRTDFYSTNPLPPSTYAPDDRIPDDLLKTGEPTKDRPLFLVGHENSRPQFSVLPFETGPVLNPEPPVEQELESDLLVPKVDKMVASMEQAMQASQEHHKLVARIAAATGMTLSAGFVIWALRSGTLLASCLATLPAWRHFDPLPVVHLSRAERTRRREEMARAGQQEATEFSGLKRVLDDKSPLKWTA